MNGLDGWFAVMASRHPHGWQLLHQRLDGELVVEWLNGHEAARLGVSADVVPVELRSLVAAMYPAWLAAFREAITSGAVERVIADSIVTFVAMEGSRVVVETRPLARAAFALPTEQATRFEKLFAQNVAGMFVTVLDTPLDWHGSTDREAMLDEAFEHLRLTAVNDVMCEQIGAPRDRLLGTVPRDRWLARRDEWRVHMAELYERGHVHHTVHAPRADGTTLLVEGEYMCTYDERGRITGHLGTQRDVSEKHQILAELAASRERLELAMLGCGLAVWDLDLTKERFTIEGSLLEWFGCSQRTDSVGWWRERVHPADRAVLDTAFADHLAGTKPVYHVECRVETAGGEWMWVMSSGRVSARSPEGRPTRVVGVCIDITDRRRLQEHVAVTERLVALGTLAAGVGHEINNPLTYLSINLELIDQGLEQRPLDELARLVATAREGAERIRKIVNNLRALSRRPDQTLTIIDPAGVIERCLEMLQHEIRHRARVEQQLGAMPPIRADEGRLVQLFSNLILNALQAIGETNAHAGSIRIATGTTADGKAVIEISDDGVGISPDILPNIFDPFFTTRPPGQGTGLGLAIAGRIVRDLDGVIEVDSAVARGSTFRIRFPAASPTTAPSEDISMQAVAKGPRRMRILVVDDDPDVAMGIVRILDEHDAIAETSAVAALARLESRECFDAILCDVMMPEVDGIAFYHRLAALDRRLTSRVVFISGGTFTAAARAFLENVPNPRLDKPLDVDVLVATLAKLPLLDQGGGPGVS